MEHGHAHQHGGPDHVPHVTPLPVYFKTFGALMVLTIITVGASYVNLGTSVNLGIALLIATIKASVVAALFMHLWHDNKFHTVILVSSGVFLLIFIFFTSFDTTARGRNSEAIRGNRAKIVADPWAIPTSSAAAAPATAAPATTAAPTGH